MNRQQIEELIPFYALDALSDEEKEIVEAYLKEYPDARQQVEELKRAAAALPYSVSPVDPSPRSKEALMRRVAADQSATTAMRDQPSTPRGMRWENFFRVFSFGAAALAILWAFVLSAQVTSLRNEIAALSQALAVQSNTIEQINANLPQGTPSGVITVSLKGTEVQPQAQGQLIADPNSQSAVLVIVGLSPLEAGRTYQVWLIQGESPQSAGLLKVDANGQGVLVVTSEAEIGSFDALGISIEPEGGSLQPEGDIVVLTTL
ncbi:MAG TPA: anti-sigma factor [Anaerolineales bacterium]|nr:anti-sigma factor [Anaerolineales bacterium]